MRFNGSIEFGERIFLVIEKKGGFQEDFIEEIVFELYEEGLVEEGWEVMGLSFWSSGNKCQRSLENIV